MKITYGQGTIRAEEIVQYLAITGMADKVFADIIRHREAAKKAREIGINPSDEQVQEFADTYRCLRGLFNAETTCRFLEKIGYSVDDFSAYCETSVMVGLLKDKLAGNREVENYFINHRLEYDMADISEIVLKDANLANEIKMQVEEDGEDFYELAKKYSLASTNKAGGYVGWVHRAALSEDVGAKVMNTDSGDLLGPFVADDGKFRLILVGEVQKANLNNAAIKESIRERLFDQWATQFFQEGVVVEG